MAGAIDGRLARTGELVKRQGRNIAEILSRPVALMSSKPALIEGNISRSWSEVGERISRLAGALRELGVKPGERVAVLSHNSASYFELYFAVPHSGGVIVPLNYRLVAPELQYCLTDSGSKLLLVDNTHLEVAKKMAGVEVICIDELEPSIPVSIPDVDEDELMGIFYTGGTTGKPKGVMLSHRNICEGAINVVIAMGYREDDVYIHAGPMFHLADGCGSFATTWLGATQVFIPTFTTGGLLDAIESHSVTTMTLAPTMYAMLLEDPEFEPQRLKSLRRIFYSASPMPPGLLGRVMKAFNCEIGQGYGMTETSARLTALSPEEHERFARSDADRFERARLASAGRPIVGTEVRVVDSEGRICAPGEVGEIVARGPNVMLGYWNDEDSDAISDGWMHTGDLAFTDDDGYVFIVDRSKDMIISGGENVYSVEVENALHLHPAVLDVAVVGIPDPLWGERVHAVVVLREGESVDAGELVEHCRQHIAGYKVPRSIEFRDSLPKSGAGKTLKRELRNG